MEFGPATILEQFLWAIEQEYTFCIYAHKLLLKQTAAIFVSVRLCIAADVMSVCLAIKHTI